MKKYGKRYIPDCGKCFKFNNRYLLTVSEDIIDRCEEVLITEKITPIGGNFLIGGKFEVKYTDSLKKKLIGSLFSNDDQIAIILNKDLGDDELEIYNLMQNWRSWFSKIIQKIKGLT